MQHLGKDNFKYDQHSEVELDHHFPLLYYRREVIDALDKEIRYKDIIKHQTNITTFQCWKISFYKKAAKRAQLDALEILLAMHCISNKIDLNCEHIIPNQDRVAVCEAIRSKLPLKYIKLVLQDYPKACESGGCVDHINHPIHMACTHHRAVVPYILKIYPDSANQPDEWGKMPFQLFLEIEDSIDVSSQKFISTTSLFTTLNPIRSKEIYSQSRESLKRFILSNYVLPFHLSKQASQDPYSIIRNQ